MTLRFILLFSCIFFTTSCNSNAKTTNGLGDLLNKTRLEHALQAVQHSTLLATAAQMHAEDMDRNHYFSHTGLNGSTHKRRIKDTGYTACYTAENIAVGQRTAADVIKAWMNSPGHRKNNLSHRAQEYGIGKAGKVWVLVLAAGC